MSSTIEKELNPPNATLYVNNLPEKMAIPQLIRELRELFEEFGDVVDIIAKKNLRAKGQAFVVFEDTDAASVAFEAITDVGGFEIGGRPMNISYAKSRSDIIVKKEDGEEEFEEHKKQRLAEKERRQAAQAIQDEQRAAKRAADSALAERPAKKAAAANAALVADEILPPNQTLVLRDLPEDYDQAMITMIFSRYPGFKEVRMVPGRAVAFAEYETIDGAVAAKSQMHGREISGKVIKVTFQRA